MSNIIKITDINQKQDKFLDSLKHRKTEKHFNVIKEMIENVDIFSIRYKVSNLGEVDCVVIQPKNLNKKAPPVIFLAGGVPNSNLHSYTKSELVSYFPTIGKGLYEDFVLFIPKYSDEETELIDTCGGDDLEIIKSLNEVIEEWEYADKENVGVWGASRGVESAVQSIKHIKNVKAALLYSGCYDLKIDFEKRHDAEEFKELFPFDASDESELEKRNALTYLGGIDKNIKMYVIHGKDDWRCFIGSVRDFVEKRREVAPDTLFDEIDSGHFIFRDLREKGKKDQEVLIKEKMIDFFKDSLLGDK